MNKKVHTRVLSKTKLQRNILSLISVVLFITTFLLIIQNFRKETIVVLVPSFMDRELKISNKRVFESYLVAESRDIITTMLNLTPHNIDFAEKSILSLVNAKYYGEISNQFNSLAQDIKKRKVSTAFYITNITTNPKNLTARIDGNLYSYLGKKEVGSQKKCYHIGFDYTGSTLTIIELYEITQEEEYAK